MPQSPMMDLKVDMFDILIPISLAHLALNLPEKTPISSYLAALFLQSLLKAGPPLSPGEVQD